MLFKKKEPTVVDTWTEVGSWMTERHWTCGTCGEQIYGRFIRALDDLQKWDNMKFNACPVCGTLKPDVEVIDRSCRHIEKVTRYSDGSKDYDDQTEYKQ